jgi:hypothetical protein
MLVKNIGEATCSDKSAQHIQTSITYCAVDSASPLPARKKHAKVFEVMPGLRIDVLKSLLQNMMHAERQVMNPLYRQYASLKLLIFTG